MTFAEDAADTLRDLEEVLDGPTCVYRGRTMPCVPSMLLRGSQLQIGGRQEDVQLSIVIRKAGNSVTCDNDIQTIDQESPARPETLSDNDSIPPAPEKPITYNQREYRILSRDEDSAGVAWKLHLGPMTRKGR